MSSQVEPEKGIESPPSEQDTLVKSAPSVKNGGLIAWLQVLGAFCLSFTTWYLRQLRYYTIKLQTY